MLRGMDLPLGPRVGVMGTFDVPNFGNLLEPRIFEHELRRRLPHARVSVYAPLGAAHPIAFEAGYAAVPLGTATAARREQLAADLDLIAIGGSDAVHVRDDLHRHAYVEAAAEAARGLEPSRFLVDGLGPELERHCRVIWHAVGIPFELDDTAAARVRASLASKRYVSVRDAVSRRRLVATGIEQEVALVPDPILLAPRVFPAETLRKRLDYLRALGAYPADERPLVVSCDVETAEGLAGLGQALAQTAEVSAGVPIVLLVMALGRGAEERVHALASQIGRAVHRLPADVTLEDLAAAITSARGFVGGSPQGCLTALAFGVPAVLVSQASGSPFEGFDASPGDDAFAVCDPAGLAGAVAALMRREDGVDTRALGPLVDGLDEHFDRIAATAEQSWSERAVRGRPPDAAIADLGRALAEAERRYDALFSAYAVRGERLLAERVRVGELLDASEGDRSTGARLRTVLELAEARNRLEIIDAERAAVRSERDEARAELERVQAERDGLRLQLAQALAEDDPARAPLLPRHA